MYWCPVYSVCPDRSLISGVHLHCGHRGWKEERFQKVKPMLVTMTVGRSLGNRENTDPEGVK